MREKAHIDGLKGGRVVKRQQILVYGALVAGVGTSAAATVLHVPGQYPTIQAGIDAQLRVTRSWSRMGPTPVMGTGISISVA
jgi:hypothetical protein